MHSKYWSVADTHAMTNAQTVHEATINRGPLLIVVSWHVTC